MYVDLISYQLAEGVDETTLENAAQDILEIWMKKQEGFLGWDLGRGPNGYTDFVYWRDKESADKATANMKDIPPRTPLDEMLQHGHCELSESDHIQII